MILIGQYDSPFVRRVGIALTTYGMAFQHKPWSVFGDADKVAKFSPLRRVPILVSEDHVAYTDSAAILAVVDDMAGAGRASLARAGGQGRDLLRISSFASGVADKGVSLVYERLLRDEALDLWVERCKAQIAETLDLLQAERAARASPYLFDAALSHADVMLAVMWTFITSALPGEFDWARWPAVQAHAALCEALPVFQTVNQPFKMVTPGEA